MFQNVVGQLATASKLAALTDESGNEIRIWQSAATFVGRGVETVGYVITASQASRCKIEYPEDGQPPFKGECTVMRKELRGFTAATLLEPLLPYANTEMGCGVVDGVWYDMDIVHNGKRFVISASNPDSCTDDGSNSVSALIEAVYRLK
ncbi:MAG TPA: hypothetical protein VGD45_28420 [Steroidobacter sp.]|uniref:hypothetical protein n=1 Tax=Steroidobacter sp. TaxID=1978227 RepID=UPI002ED9FFBD